MLPPLPAGGRLALAIDWSKVQDVLPIVNVAMLDGDGQKGAIGNALEKPLRVKVTSLDPTYSLAGAHVTFTVKTFPTHALAYGIGADENAATTTYTATADANGIAGATLVLGDTAGTYTVEASAPLMTSPPVTFTATAKKPSSLAILKDSTELADRTDTYAVSAKDPTTFYVFGLDTDGSKLGPVKSTWSLSASGPASTRGSGAVAPTTPVSTTTFSPAGAGKMTIKANPLISGVSTGSAGLFITALYVEVDNFDVNNPIDELPQFLPGGHTDGSSITPTAMPQQIKLHVLTGASSKGTVTFELSNVSNYPGIAMNYPLSSPQTNPDMYFPGGTTSVMNFSGTGDTVGTLSVNDYAANGKLKVTIKSGKLTYTLAQISLPIDDNGNKIADRGWKAQTATINDTALDASADEDNTPAMTVSLPDTSSGLGDNLTDFEEYRGFVVFGAWFPASMRRHSDSASRQPRTEAAANS